MKKIFWFAVLITVANACGKSGTGQRHFDLTVVADGFADYEGSNVFAALADLPADDSPVERSAIIESGAFVLEFVGGLPEGDSVRLSYFVDDNRSGLCDPPPKDVGFVHEFTEISHAIILEVSGNDKQSNPCEDFLAP